MALDRKAIRTALYNRLKADLADVVKTFKLQEEGAEVLDETKYPCLELTARAENVDASERDRAPKWLLRYDVQIYIKPSPTEKDSAAFFDKYIGALEAALEPHAGETTAGWYTTLGGIVSRAYIVGPVERDVTLSNPIQQLTCPIEVIVPTMGYGRPPA